MARSIRAGIVIGALLGGIFGSGSGAIGSDQFDSHFRSRPPHFVPNSQRFWDNSKNWTTNFGPAYRDTVEKVENLVPCTGTYALCFHSGSEPLPCEIDRSGRFADCTCTVQREINFVLISAILNYKVYLDTIAKCGVDGSGCTKPDEAPVCEAIRKRKLIRGADVISTFSGKLRSQFEDLPASGSDAATEPTICPKGPYAGCMTAPCERTSSDEAVCTCPVFYGPFQLTGEGVECTLDDGLVNSASYSPALDTTSDEAD